LLDVLRTGKSVCNRKRKISLYVYEIRDYHSGVPEDSVLLRCDGVSLDEETPTFLWKWWHYDHRKFGKYEAKDSTSNCRRLESSLIDFIRIYATE